MNVDGYVIFVLLVIYEKTRLNSHSTFTEMSDKNHTYIHTYIHQMSFYPNGNCTDTRIHWPVCNVWKRNVRCWCHNLNLIYTYRQRHRSCTVLKRLEGLFIPNDSVTVTVTLIGGPFDLFDGHCDRQNGLHVHFPINVRFCDGGRLVWMSLNATLWCFYT